MSDSKFDESTQSLWLPYIENGVLYFKNKYGGVIESKPKDTLLFENDLSKKSDKYINISAHAAYNPINPIQYIDAGCDKCNNKYLKYIRTGDNQNITYFCNCL